MLPADQNRLEQLETQLQQNAPAFTRWMEVAAKTLLPGDRQPPDDLIGPVRRGRAGLSRPCRAPAPPRSPVPDQPARWRPPAPLLLALAAMACALLGIGATTLAGAVSCLSGGAMLGSVAAFVYHQNLRRSHTRDAARSRYGNESGPPNTDHSPRSM